MQVEPRKGQYSLVLWLSIGHCDADAAKEKAAENTKEKYQQVAAGATEAEDAVEVQSCPAIRNVL